MKTSELIKYLQAMPQDADCEFAFDGAIRSDVSYLWLTKDNRVALAGSSEYVTAECDFPSNVPFEHDKMFKAPGTYKPIENRDLTSYIAPPEPEPPTDEEIRETAHSNGNLLLEDMLIRNPGKKQKDA